MVSPEHEEYRAESYDQVDEFHFDVAMSVIKDEGAIEQDVAVAVSAWDVPKRFVQETGTQNTKKRRK